MNGYWMKKLMVLSLGGVLVLPVFAWPEVDHMNMCGAATKSVQAYAGNWKGWGQHDNYIARRGSAYYLRTNCPKTVAPTKKKASYKIAKVVKAKKVRKVVKRAKVKSVRRISKKRSTYNEKLDCARVDRLNGYGLK